MLGELQTCQQLSTLVSGFAQEKIEVIFIKLVLLNCKNVAEDIDHQVQSFFAFFLACITTITD